MTPARQAPLESINIGEIRVTYLPDGEGYGAAHVLFPAGDEAFWASHADMLNAEGRLLVSFGGFLIEAGDQKVLVDTGFGDMTHDAPDIDGRFQGGKFLDSLNQTGHEPADIDTVVYSHFHLDHLGWTARDGSLTFANARHLAGEGEWDFWQGDVDPLFASVGPYPEVLGPLADRIEPVSDGETIAPGVNVMATPGHTPGHTSLVVSSGTDRAVILGDILHCPVQIDRTQMAIIFEVDPVQGARTRERIIRELEDPGTVSAFNHFSNSVFGRVFPGTGKRWTTVG